MSAVRIQASGLDEMIESFDRLARSGPAEAAAKMDAHLAAGFAETQAALAPHTETGRTAASGRVMSSFTGSEWTGTIEYGIEGPEGEHETGAVWLLADGTDYLAPLGRTSEQVGEVLDAYFREALEG